MRPLPLILLAALLLAGGLGWLLFSSDGNQAVPIAELPEKAKEQVPNLPIEPMTTPTVSTRSTVEPSEEAKAKALLDIRSEPPEEELGPVGAVTILVVDQEGEPMTGVFIELVPLENETQFVAKGGSNRATEVDGRARFEELPVGQHRFGIIFNPFFAMPPTRGSDLGGNLGAPRQVIGIGKSNPLLELGLLRKLIALNPLMNEDGFITTFVREGGEANVRIVIPKLHALAGVVRDANGPLPDATVRLYLNTENAINAEGGRTDSSLVSEYPYETLTRTDAEGKFRIGNLTQGEYAISVERPDGGMRQHWDIELPDRSASVELVLDDLAVHGLVTTPEGVPIAGARLVVERVRLDDKRNPQPSEIFRANGSLYEAGMTASVESAADGSYRIEGVDGTRPLVVTARTPWKTTTRSRIFGFEDGEEQREINIAMTTTGVVIARLVASKSYPNFAVAVTPVDQENPRTILSPDTSRQTTLHGLAPGRYLFELQFDKKSSRLSPFMPEPIEGEVIAEEALTIEFTGQ